MGHPTPVLSAELLGEAEWYWLVVTFLRHSKGRPRSATADGLLLRQLRAQDGSSAGLAVNGILSEPVISSFDSRQVARPSSVVIKG